uniref:Uncharacterized protein n=1 Tax=Kwoniella bestiolae CBS 10118 TaxID=1296100 RepID=A0A1B9G932_9TREE|nr:hypothetical protein I302_02374 [Kwoniella bestiolae CBS 10118]OCF27532.1 hypothetical protein I302_02374 [Kwoniella bestiolae CBS 10118]
MTSEHSDITLIPLERQQSSVAIPVGSDKRDDDTSHTSDTCNIPPELRIQFSARLESGLDRPDKIDDPFVNSIKREHVRVYTRDNSIVQPSLTEMVNQSTSEEQLGRLRGIMDERSVGDCLWVNVLGVEEGVINGITHLFITEVSLGLKDTHNEYIYTPESANQTPVYDLVKNVFKPDKICPKGGLATAAEEEVEVEKMIRRGFLSIFIVPSTSRLVIRSAHLDMGVPGQMDMACNAALLGLSMVHRSVGYASSSIKPDEAHRLVVELQDFKSRIRPLQKVVVNLTKHYQSTAGYGIDGYHSSGISNKASLMLEQCVEALERIVEEAEELLEKSKNLETYCFNILSTRANDSMERLAIVTIVFLPLTFIGFEQFTDLNRPPIYFWQISIPLSFTFFLIFAYSSLKRGLIRLLHLIRRLRRWTKKQTKWWKVDVELWWRRRRVGWSGKRGEIEYERTRGQS